MFGDLVRVHRRRLGLSQQELAEKAGMSVRGLRKIEVHQVAAPRPVTVRLLADAFGLSGAEREQFCASALHEPVEPAAEQPSGTLWPAQLPADVPDFTGRTDHLRRLTALLDRHDDAGPQATLIIAIAGTAGVGKTALAVHWAHQVRHRFPDGQLYVNLRGFDPSGAAMDPAEAVRWFLDALEVPPERIPTDLDAQAALYRTLLADRRMLIVLDNARDAEQVRPLLPGAPGCLVVMTSRNHLTSLVAADGAYPIAMSPPSHDEARQLLARRLGEDRIAAEPRALDEIITRCARLPLGLAVAAARAATQPDLPLGELATELGDGRRLDALVVGDDPATDVRAVFSWSYRTLSPPAARLFRLLGVHPGPDISVPAAASLAGVPLPRVRSLLTELASAHLIVEHAYGRYAFHDLLRAYAAEQARTVQPEQRVGPQQRGPDRQREVDQQREAAVHRVLDHYLQTGFVAARLLHPARDPITLAAPLPGVTPEHLAGHKQALAWFTTEHPVLLAVIDQASRTGLDAQTWRLAWVLVPFLDRRGHWHDYYAAQGVALAAAQRAADPSVQALVHRYLARSCHQLGRFDDAYVHLQYALEMCRRVGDRVGQANSHTHLAGMWERQGRYAEALVQVEQALELYQAAGHRSGQAIALNNIGWLHALLGNHDQALAPCRRALALERELRNRLGEARAWDSVGYAHHNLGQYDEAVACYQRALGLFRDLGDRHNEAVTLVNLGDSHHAAGGREAARDAWNRAWTILDGLRHSDAERVRAKLAALERNTAPG